MSSFAIGDRVEMKPEYRDWGRKEPLPRKVGTVVGGLADFATVWVEWDCSAYGSSSCSPELLDRLPIDFGSAEVA